MTTTTTTQKVLLSSGMLMAMLVGVWGHGMVINPPQRSSRWRYDPSAPINYDDNQLFCGGFNVQWNVNGGKCGICGDPYNASEPLNEAGGVYDTGTIVATYQQATVIKVTVEITANHMGYFVFKLCPDGDLVKDDMRKCLDDHVLKVLDSNGEDLGERYHIDSNVGKKNVDLQLPSDVTCTHCVLQWTYNTGNSWGCGEDGVCCVGCGPQENFVNCVDIAITASDDTNAPTTTEKPKVTDSTEEPKKTESPTDAPTTPQPTTTPEPTTPQPTTTPEPTTPQPTTTPEPTTPQPTTTQATSTTQGTAPSGMKTCHAVDPYSAIPGMDDWCQVNCVRLFCPTTHCICI